MRYGHELIPFCGVGHWLVHVQGSPSWVCAWPITAELAMGQDMSSMYEYIGSLGEADMSKFVGQSCFHTLLETDRVCWIPHGWSFVICTLTDPADASSTPASAMTSIMAIPHFNDKMTQGLGSDTASAMRDSVSKFVTSGSGSNSAAWKEHGPAFVQWLDSVCAATGAVAPAMLDSVSVVGSSSAPVISPAKSTLSRTGQEQFVD
jgi:hypothetical protein